MTDADKKKILLVEDDIIIAMNEKQQLEKYGYSVYHAANGEDAVKIIREDVFPSDLILMDIDLGAGIDGTQAAGEILNYKDIPVVFLSSHTEPELVAKTEKITSFGYVVKDSGIVVLDASIKMALKLFHAKTEESKARQTINFQRNFYEDILEQSLAGYWDWDIFSGNEYLSPTFKKMFGYDVHEIENRAESWQKLIFKDDLPVIFEKYNHHVESKGRIPFYAEVRFRHKNGSTVWVICTGKVIEWGKNGEPKRMIGCHIDITERKKIELNYENLFNKSLDGLANHEIICDQSGNPVDYRFLSINPAFEQITGFKKEEVIGRTVLEVLPNTEPYWIRTYGKVALSGEPIVFDNYASEFDKHFKVTAFSPAPQQFTCVFQDITILKQTEDKIKQQLSEKEILLREVHHRIKNNMASVESLLSLQAGSISNQEAKTALQDSISRVHSIRILYDKLLLNNNYNEVSIKSYIEGLLDAISAVFAVKDSVIINKEITDFTIDSKKAISLGIIINELLTNVFKYAFADSADGIVSISIDKKGNDVTLVIRDNGKGRSEKNSSNESPGLGLTIVKILAEQLRGTYTAERTNGTKTVIRFQL